jgi:hypothetical protein
MLAACASPSPHSLPQYRPPPAGTPAATLQLGRFAHVWRVDDAETPSFASAVRVSPGEHRIGMNCLSFEIDAVHVFTDARGAPVASTAIPKTTIQSVALSGNFQAGVSYYARCVAVGGKPRAWLADTPHGDRLPEGFTSLCTRSCD